MTCSGSPRFNPVDPMKRFPLTSEEEESMEEEEEEDTASNMFDFEDIEDLDDVVDYRPRGEVLNRIEEQQNRERRANETYSDKKGHEFVQNEETSFLTLDSLDEEVDSDESGYVEAPPKSLLSQDDRKEEEESDRSRLESSFKNQLETVTARLNIKIDKNENQRMKHEDPKVDKQKEIESKKMEKDSLLVVDDNQRIKERERERADFKYPISETIKKLASASLRSKSLEMTSNNCLNVLNFKTSKSFDSVRNDEIMESPSLHQRKQLLAQHGVMV